MLLKTVLHYSFLVEMAAINIKLFICGNDIHCNEIFKNVHNRNKKKVEFCIENLFFIQVEVCYRIRL